MGADAWAIARLLLVQFMRPLLAAGVLALVVGNIMAGRLLEGYTSHVDNSIWLHLVVLGAALGFALVVVASHVLLIARMRPAEALQQ